ncbi:YlxR family protein [Nocardioides salsibiostraticola]
MTVIHQDVPRSRTPSGREPTSGPGPVRTCVGCRRRATKRELLRVTVGSDTDGRPVVVADPVGARPGRGAHVHPTFECVDLAVSRKAFGRALRVGPAMPVAPLDEHLHHAPTEMAGVPTGQTEAEPTRSRSSSS